MAYNAEFPPVADDAKPGSADYETIEWCKDRLEQAKGFVQSSIGYNRIDKALSAVFAQEQQPNASYVPGARALSRTYANLVAKTAEDLTAMLTDTRVFWNYATTNPKYEVQARIANKTATAWYQSRLIDLRIADVIRYYTVAGTGYLHLFYSRRLDDMMVEAEDPRNVYPLDPISYHTLQDAQGVFIRKARTVSWVEAEYHKTVKPDVGGENTGFMGWLTRTLGQARTKVTGPLSKRSSGDQAIPGSPTVFVTTLYLNDPRLNKKSEPVYMGKWDSDGTPLTPWSYKVDPGMPLYPFKRMIVWAGDVLLSDGPSPYWHAQFPIIKLTLNPWPGAWLGKAPLWDVIPLNQSLNALLRVIDDHAGQIANPGVVADRNVSKAELDKFDSRTPGYQIRTNMSSGKGIQVQPPPPLDQSLWEHVKWIQDMIQQLSGTADMSQVAKLNQLPSNDTIDAIMAAMTPGNRARSRICEGFMKELAEMYLFCIAEFDSVAKRVARFGPSAITDEDSDFDPGHFIPDDVPDGDPGDIAAQAGALSDGPRPIYERAKQMIMGMSYTFKPGSLLNSAAQQDRMEDLMLSKMGYLSVFTLMENLGKMNFAPPSVVVPNSELERLMLQQRFGIGMLANAQGRKATDAAPPQLTNNGGGDVTLQTSS